MTPSILAKRDRSCEENTSDATQKGEASRANPSPDSELATWHPEWKPEQSTDLPQAKRQRLLQTSRLYDSLRGSVFKALEAREQHDSIERAKSHEIALRYPLKPGDERMSSPAQFYFQIGDCHASCKVTPCLSPNKNYPKKQPPTLLLEESKRDRRTVGLA